MNSRLIELLFSCFKYKISLSFCMKTFHFKIKQTYSIFHSRKLLNTSINDTKMKKKSMKEKQHGGKFCLHGEPFQHLLLMLL